jgi:hypothetical protein
MSRFTKTVIVPAIVAGLVLTSGNILVADPPNDPTLRSDDVLPVAAYPGDVDAVRVSTGKVMAVKDFVSGMPKVFKGHREAVISSLESAEAEMWKAISAGGASTVFRYKLTISGGNKIGKCIAVLQDVRQELKDAQGGMKGHCLRARQHIEAAIEHLEMAQSVGKNR